MKRIITFLLIISALSVKAQVPLAGEITTIGAADTYPLLQDTLLRGGYQTVYSKAVRDAIPAARRKVGMMVRVSSIDSTYVLSGGITNSNWQVFSSGITPEVLSDSLSFYARLSDGVVTGLTPTTNGDSLLIASGTYRLNGIIKTATSYVFGDIPPSSVGLSRVLVVYGLNTGVLDTLSGAESNNPVAPTFGADTVILVQVLVSDAGLGVPTIDDNNYAKLSGGNTFSGIQDFNNRVRVFDDLYFDQIPVRSWTIKADSGFLKIKSGDALSSVDFQNQPTYLGTKLIADTTVYRTVSNSYSLSSGQAKLTAINFGNFMDIGLSTKLTPSSGDFLLGRDFLTNEAVEIPFSTVQPAGNYVTTDTSQTITANKAFTGDLTVDNTIFNTSAGETPSVGKLSWNDADGTLNLGLKGGNVVLQIGQEQLVRVVNKVGSTLLESNYQAVRVDGAQGQRLKVALALADNDANSAETIGLVTETILDNEEGFVTVSGLVRNINTTGSLQSETWVDGDILYLSGTVAGRITKVKPVAPTHSIIIGYVVHAHATQGSIYVKVNNGYELDELHNVKITSVANNEGLFYDSAQSIWVNKTISSALGYTPYNPSSYPVNFGGETLQSVTNRGSVTTTDIIANNLESKNYLRVTDLGGVKRILLGNQNSLGVNKPSIIESANSNISFGYGDTWTADGGNFTSRVFIKNDDNSGNVGIGTTTVPEKLNIAGTTRATNFGANIAPNTNFGFTGAASTSTTAPFLITPGVAYTGTQNGALWYETTNSRLRMYRSSQVDDIVTTGSNILFGGTGVRAVTATTDGSLAATTPILSVFTTDSDVITAITGATYSGNRATITPAGGKVFYQGQMYDDGSFTYLAIADNSVRRF